VTVVTVVTGDGGDVDGPFSSLPTRRFVMSVMVQSSRQPGPARNGAAPRILLAEDDTEMRSLVGSALRLDGYDVVEASDGGRMLVHLASAYGGGEPRATYDLLISDIRMPVCSGLQILESLRLAHWKTPAILMTAFGDDKTRSRALDLGAILFAKPFDVDDLRTAVMHLVHA
jgi:DNA-binding response OmpR family regulator